MIIRHFPKSQSQPNPDPHPNPSPISLPTNFFKDAYRSIQESWSLAYDLTKDVGLLDENKTTVHHLAMLNPQVALRKPISLQAGNSILQLENLISRHKSVLRETPMNFNSWKHCLFYSLLRGDWVTSFDALSHVEAIKPDFHDPFLLFTAAIVYQQFNNMEKALVYYKTLINTNPKCSLHDDIEYRYAIFQRGRERYDEAIRIFKRIQYSPPPGLIRDDIVFQIAFTHQLKGTLAHSNECYQKLMDKYPDNTEVIGQYCWSLSLQKDKAKYEIAEARLKKSQQKHPSDFNIAFTLGRILMMRKKYAEAFQYLGSLVPAFKDSPILWCAYGNLYYNNCQFEDAIEAYKRSITIDMKYSEAWLNLGLVLLNMDESLQAIRLYQKGKELMPANYEFDHRIQMISTSPIKARKYLRILDVAEYSGMSHVKQPAQIYADLHLWDPPVYTIECFDKEDLTGEELERIIKKHKSLFT